MNGKITLFCRACGCATELKISGRPLAAPYICQSCGQELSAEDQERLNAAMLALWDLPAVTADRDGFVKNGEGFQIKFNPSPLEDLSE